MHVLGAMPRPVTIPIVSSFRLSLTPSDLPNDWRMARAVPVLENGDPLSRGNYRSISMTCTSFKLMEHIVSTISNVLEENNAITRLRHGFRRVLSTATQAPTTVYDSATSLDKSAQTDVTFLDFHEAFDKVPRGYLPLS